MIQALKENWRQFKRGKPGERFEERYRRKQGAGRGKLHGPLMMAAGVLLLVAGLILIPAPGPGALIVVAGAALIAQESLAAARFLDRAEMRLRDVIGRRRP